MLLNAYFQPWSSVCPGCTWREKLVNEHATRRAADLKCIETRIDDRARSCWLFVLGARLLSHQPKRQVLCAAHIHDRVKKHAQFTSGQKPVRPLVIIPPIALRLRELTRLAAVHALDGLRWRLPIDVWLSIETHLSSLGRRVN